jgi:hypothetical protein
MTLSQHVNEFVEKPMCFERGSRSVLAEFGELFV